MFIIGEKLLFTGTLAPRNGLNRYGFGTPTPNTCLKEGGKCSLSCFTTFLEVQLCSMETDQSETEIIVIPSWPTLKKQKQNHKLPQLIDYIFVLLGICALGMSSVTPPQICICKFKQLQTENIKKDLPEHVQAFLLLIP